MTKHPFLSVIVPAYNCSTFISSMLRSVADQSFENFEIIIIDDGSSDNTYDIAKQFAVNDSRFAVIKQQNAGPSVARRTGLGYAKGEYLYFMDADDLIEPGCFSALFNKAEQSDAEMIFVGITNEDENGNVLGVSPKYPSGEGVTKMDIFRHMFTGSGAVAMYSYFVKRSIFDVGIKWYDDMLAGEDGLVTVQLVYNSNTFATIQGREFYRYIKRTGALSSGKFSDKKAADQINYPERIREFFSNKPEYIDMQEMLYALKAQGYAYLLSHGYFKNASLFSRDIIASIKRYPSISKLHLVRAFIKPIKLFAINWVLGRIFCQYYIIKGKIVN